MGNLSGTNTGDQNLTALSLKSNVLELDNTTTFTPDADYEPATKKYVDDISITESQISDLQSYLTSYTETDPSYTSSEAANITASDITNLGNLSGTNTGDMTNTEVKTAYEANTNTNAFTDTYKTKIDGIAAGAEVNTVNSVAGKTGAVTLAKADVGLGNVDNTTDANKPVSTATQTALDLKANLASPTFTGTVSGVTKAHVGLGNVDNTTDANKPVSTATQTALDLKANLASPTFTGTVSGVTKAHVGLGNVDNTTDANKPISTATQTALDLKANLASPTFIGTVSGVTKAHVGLGNVDNTTDANKPVSTAAQTALNLKANKSNVLELDNTTTFTPDADYEPATKKYVDELKAQIRELEIVTGIRIKDFDGNDYGTVTIGTQTWMAENLKTTKYNDGTGIPLVTDNTAWSNLVTPGYCWHDNDEVTYGETYGALYNWYTVNTGILCPTGWHIPTYTECTTLIDYLGGISIAGGKLKEVGTTHWQSPNVGATNESGFTAVPNGERTEDGIYTNSRTSGYWWSSTEYIVDTSDAGFFKLRDSGINASTSNYNKKCGYSIRCVRDN